MQSFGLWTQERLNRFNHDLQSFFRAYYSELLKLVEEHDSDDLPDWVRGRRLIHVYACADGVIVGHVYPDKTPSHATPEIDVDGNIFWFQLDPGRLVKEAIEVFKPAPRLGGSDWPQWNPPNYQAGQPFGSHVITTPLEIDVQLDAQGKNYTREVWDVWSRLEWSDMQHTVRYQDEALAMREAQALIHRLAQE